MYTKEMSILSAAFLAAVSLTAQTVRTERLDLSGPTMDSVGGPGPHFMKYNSSPEAGSAVREGLIPDIRPFLDAQVRDTQICRGGDGRYYMTGSTGDDIWKENAGVELWVSDDLRKWEYLGLVWTFEKDATWEREWKWHRQPVRALWAPEIHFVRGNYYVTYSMPPGDRGILKSVSGRPEGPYVNALAADGKFEGGIDGSLFEDEDGKVYYLWDGGKIALMKDDMSGFADAPFTPALEVPDTVASHHAASCARHRKCADIGHEGTSLFKRGGLYYLTAADSYEGRYSSMAAVSENIRGPYRMRHEAVPCGGGTGYFKDDEGNWWCCFFGNDSQSPFREMPALVSVDFTDDGHIIPARTQPMLDSAARTRWTAAWDKVWKEKYKQ